MQEILGKLLAERQREHGVAHAAGIPGVGGVMKRVLLPASSQISRAAATHSLE